MHTFAPKHDRVRGGAGNTRPARRQGRLQPLAELQRSVGNRALQSLLTVSTPGDAVEREAERLADGAMSKSALHADRAPSGRAIAATPAGGAPLPRAIRRPLEERFGADLSRVRLHVDDRSAALSKALHANAVTIGQHIYFRAPFHPLSRAGRRLLAHELAHTLQPAAEPRIRRDCADPLFCTPLGSWAEVIAAQTLIRAVYLPADEAMFGADSRRLYEAFLSRRPGDSLAPVVFDTPGSAVVSSFAESWAIADDQDAIIDSIGARLNRAPLRDGVTTMMPVSDFLSRAELDDRDITFSNPFSIAGHLAGGIGSSAAGPDRRRVDWGNVTLTRVNVIGGLGWTHVETALHYEVTDAVDFCPGDCGSIAEQAVTVPMSRLEASGQAYDVPFVVRFLAPSRSKRFFFT